MHTLVLTCYCFPQHNSSFATSDPSWCRVCMHLYDLATQVASYYFPEDILQFSCASCAIQLSDISHTSYLRVVVVRKPDCMVWLHHFHSPGHFNPVLGVTLLTSHAKKQGNVTSPTCMLITTNPDANIEQEITYPNFNYPNLGPPK